MIDLWLGVFGLGVIDLLLGVFGLGVIDLRLGVFGLGVTELWVEVRVLGARVLGGCVETALPFPHLHSALPYSVDASLPQTSHVHHSVPSPSVLSQSSAVLYSVIISEAHFSAVM